MAAECLDGWMDGRCNGCKEGSGEMNRRGNEVRYGTTG